MPLWLSITLGVVAGLAIVALVIFVSIRPYLAVKPPESRLAEPSGNENTLPYGGGMPPDGPGWGQRATRAPVYLFLSIHLPNAVTKAVRNSRVPSFLNSPCSSNNSPACPT